MIELIVYRKRNPQENANNEKNATLFIVKKLKKN